MVDESHTSIRTSAVVHFNRCSVANTVVSVWKSFRHTQVKHQNTSKALPKDVHQYPGITECDNAQAGVVTWPGSQRQGQFCQSPSHAISLPFPTLLWLNALRGRVNRNSIKHQTQSFYRVGAESSSYPMCWCIYTAQHKFYKEAPPFALTTELLPILAAVYSIPLNGIATPQWIQGFLGHPQEALFLLIM